VGRDEPAVAVIEAALPPDALLGRYQAAGDYTDGFVVTVPGRVTQAAYVEAFYTTSLFRLERLVLAALVSRPSTDDDVRRLASGEAEAFAAWTVEARTPDQILLCDFQGATRSWLMSAPDAQAATTTLWFGSAVVRRKGARRLGPGFRAMLPFHRLYARALLRAAVRRLKAG
jgi:hypothetical protein